MTIACYQVQYDDGKKLYFEAAHKAGALREAREFRPHTKVVAVERIGDFHKMDGSLCIEDSWYEQFDNRPTLWPMAAYD